MREKGFFCPFCRSRLSSEKDGTLTLLGFLSGENFSVRSIFRLSSEIGVYGGKPEYEGLDIKAGARVEFCCPRDDCGHTLRAAYDDDLAEILWSDENEAEHLVAFSRSMGRQMTFIIDTVKGELVASHGRHRSELSQRIREHLTKNPYKPNPSLSVPG